jgi:formylglycine-generating enzyme required for sulfatase activity
MAARSQIMGSVCAGIMLSVTAHAEWVNSLGMHFQPVPSSSARMATWETRVKDFAAFVDATGHNASERFFYYRGTSWNIDTNDWRYPGFDQTGDHPVIGVSWRDAVKFCNWLTEHERKLGVITSGQAYRLPLDSEWTAAAGHKTDLVIPPNHANVNSVLNIDTYEVTSPVGTFPANEFGFYDMIGNAWEYCLDRASERHPFRIIRGGSWQNWHGKYVGIHARGKTGMDVRITLYGFRIVLDVENELTAHMRQDAMVIPPPPEELSEE